VLDVTDQAIEETAAKVTEVLGLCGTPGGGGDGANPCADL
jgi:hypothetical protein